jgi:hypothetical protein
MISTVTFAFKAELAGLKTVTVRVTDCPRDTVVGALSRTVALGCTDPVTVKEAEEL